MNFNIEYKVKDIPYWNEEQKLYVSVITDNEKFNMDILSDNINKIRLYDSNRNWFIAKNCDVLSSSTEEKLNSGKFIKYQDKEGNITTVVFSKLINHNDMNLIIHKISFKNKLHWVAKSAGFVSGSHFYGESETMKLDCNGNKI